MRPLVDAAALSVPLRFVVGLGAAVLATLAMDLVMARLPEGATPPAVAAGVLTGTAPADAPARLGAVVHYLAGGLTGPSFVWLSLLAEGLTGTTGPAVTLGVAAVLYLLMVGFFAVVVLPRSLVAPDRVSAIRRDWALDAAVYVAVLVPLVAAGSGLLPAAG